MARLAPGISRTAISAWIASSTAAVVSDESVVAPFAVVSFARDREHAPAEQMTTISATRRPDAFIARTADLSTRHSPQSLSMKSNVPRPALLGQGGDDRYASAVFRWPPASLALGRSRPQHFTPASPFSGDLAVAFYTMKAEWTDGSPELLETSTMWPGGPYFPTLARSGEVTTCYKSVKTACSQ